MGKGYDNLNSGDFLKDLQDDDFVPADYNTQDMRNINEKVNRILYGNSSDDAVDINKISEKSKNVEVQSADNQNVEISSYSDGKKRNKDVDDFIYSTEENNSNKKKKGMSTKKKVTIGSVVAVAVLLCLVLVLVIQAVVAPKDNVLADMGVIEKETDPVVISNKDGEFVFAEGCKVSNVDISGLTMEEAKGVLAQAELESRPNIDIAISVDDEKNEYTQDDFTFTYNTEDVLEKAKEFSEKLATGATLPTSVDSEGNSYFTDSVYEITATLNDSSINKLVKKLNKKYDKKATNAKVKSFNPDSSDMFTFAKGKNGKEFDEDAVLAELKEVFSSGSADAGYQGDIATYTQEVAPEVSVQYLKDNIQLLAQWTTISTNNANGNENMRVSLKACNGSIIDPGEVWSFNDCTGDSNDPDNGYKKAGVIVDGSYTDGYGGGICQSSTTIFNAAVRSNLEIYERNNHTYPSSYAYSGFDAAIDYGNFDLKLKNNSDYQVFLSCYMEGTTLYATFYGIKTGSYATIDTYSENYDITSSYYRSRSYRIYKDKNGDEIDREELPTSYYSLANNHSVQTADSGGTSYVSGGYVYKNSTSTDTTSSSPSSVSSTASYSSYVAPATKATSATSKPKATSKPASKASSTTQSKTQAPTTAATESASSKAESASSEVETTDEE
jgi:vancomycin resistance protein YoaR